MGIEFTKVPSPCFVLEEERLIANLQKLQRVQTEAPVKIILALKGFAMWSVFPLVRKYLSGTTASSLNEARLGFEEFSPEVHAYAPAYTKEEWKEFTSYCSHITFNSLAQFNACKSLPSTKKISFGLRINPEYSEAKVEMYNPCATGSRLGIRKEQLKELPQGVDGLHVHNLCENNSFALEKTLQSVKEKFGHLLPQLRWLNMGGGHLITHKEYNIGHLISVLTAFKKEFPNLELIMEPGAAIAWETGYLVSTVLDIVESAGVNVAILDVSFSAHMPDCLEMPYKPMILGATDSTPSKPTYRMGGMTCLAGDFVGDYSFNSELKVGDRIVFNDMMHYTMVKTTMFNGVTHPSIGIWTEEQTFKMVKKFGYQEYKEKLS